MTTDTDDNTTRLNNLAHNVTQELKGDTPAGIAGKRSLTTTQLAFILTEAGHHQLAHQIQSKVQR